jgi:polar amino acid transport system permease protein
MYEWNFAFLAKYSPLLINGTYYTIIFTVVTAALGLGVGLLIAILRVSGIRLLAAPLVAVIEVFRCTPVLVQLIWFYYAFPILVGVEMSPATAAVLALALYGGSFYAEIIRGGIISIERGQWDAGRAIGMRHGQVLRRVILPQSFRRMVPPLVGQSILQLKNTSLVSVLAVPDLLYQGQAIAAATYRPLETYTVIAVIYFLILFPLTRLAEQFEARLHQN